jgi:glycosyltransferase involved in cell wall biosynthesis
MDDGSSDGTFEFLKNWAKENSKVRIHNLQSVGLVKALNLGISIAEGDWIARYDVDDRYSPNRIRIQKQLIKSGTVAIFSDYSLHAGSRKLGQIPSGVNHEAIAISLVRGQRTAHPSALFNKQACESVGGYILDEFLVEDLGLWLRMSQIGELKSVPLELLKYELSSNSITQQNRKLMPAKKAELLRKYPINIQNYEFCVENFKFLYDNEPGLQYRDLRLFLLSQELRDFISLNKSNVIEVKQLIGKKGILTSRPVWCSWQVLKFIVSTVRRRFFRAFNFRKRYTQ